MQLEIKKGSWLRIGYIGILKQTLSRRFGVFRDQFKSKEMNLWSALKQYKDNLDKENFTDMKVVVMCDRNVEYEISIS